MQTETKIGIVLGLAVVVGASVYFARSRRDERDLILALAPPASKPPQGNGVKAPNQSNGAAVKPGPLFTRAAPRSPQVTMQRGRAMTGTPATPVNPAVMHGQTTPVAGQQLNPNVGPTGPVRPASTPPTGLADSSLRTPASGSHGMSADGLHANGSPPSDRQMVPSGRGAEMGTSSVRPNAPVEIIPSGKLAEATGVQKYLPPPQSPSKSRANEAVRPSPISSGHAPAAEPLRVQPSKVEPPRETWPKHHVIEEGDTLAVIAHDVYGDAKYVSLIVSANPAARDARHLKIGTKLTLPAPDADKKAEAVTAEEKKETLIGRPGPVLTSGGEPTTGTPASAAPGKSTEKPAAEPKPGKYTVRSGDSLFSIAEEQLHNGQRWKELMQLNRDKLRNPNQLKPGMVLTLPTGEAATATPAKSKTKSPHRAR